VDAVRENQKVVEVWGTGNASREFLYVDDAAKGIILATEKYNKSEPINLGAGSEISIKKLVELIQEHTGFSGNIQWNIEKPDGQPRRSLVISRAKQEFGFKATMPFDEGLQKTIEWYQENYNKKIL
jgi:GDP-L-fucose synthase